MKIGTVFYYDKYGQIGECAFDMQRPTVRDIEPDQMAVWTGTKYVVSLFLDVFTGERQMKIGTATYYDAFGRHLPEMDNDIPCPDVSEINGAEIVKWTCTNWGTEVITIFGWHLRDLAGMDGVDITNTAAMWDWVKKGRG